MTYDRPWGKFEVLHETETYKVKKITINPYQQISLQYHNHRDEFWTVVEGYGKVIIDGDEYPAEPKSFFHIPKNSVHRASSLGDELVFIETQFGECSEEDIVRLQDDYKRR
jgi:mannose-6-phosphate isomerase